MRGLYVFGVPGAVLIVCMVLAGWILYNPGDTPAAPMETTSQMAAKATEPEVLSDPHSLPDFPEGSGKEVFLANCVTCHSPRYVTMQPRFPEKVWKAEVAKMVTAYKAPIAPAQQEQIVRYLAASFGPEAAH